MIEILLVDDESYVTESLAQTIPWREMGIIKVIQASSAEEALRIMEREEIDILVTDIRMPEMDGLKLIETVSENWPNVRSILLTGHSDFEYAKKALQLRAFDYILKPVNDEEFVMSISGAIESLKDEWEQSDKYNRLLYDRKSDLSVLQANLMHDLFLGRWMPRKTVRDKLLQYDIPIMVEEPAVLMLIELGRPFSDEDQQSVTLLEYAAGNIAEEVFANSFHVWHGRAPHNCLALVAALKKSAHDAVRTSDQYELERRRLLEKGIKELRKNAAGYLKCELSIWITPWFSFPDEIAEAYRSALGGLLPSERDGSGKIVFLEDRPITLETSVKSIEKLYKPPTLIHLLESKQWQAAEDKILEVFADLGKQRYSQEHLYAVVLSVTNAFMYTAHKQGHMMYRIDPAGYNPLFDSSMLHSLQQAQNWSVHMLNKLKAELSDSDMHNRSYMIKQVQELVSSELGQETSVKTIADRVFLHPVYLSKIYKAETGESLGDYIIRTRMEKALYLLKYTNKKIYEITSELGYQNPQYFSKMFRKYYGMSPNEFREK